MDKEQIKQALLSNKRIVTTEEGLNGKLYKSVFEYLPESDRVRVTDYIVYGRAYKRRFGVDSEMELTAADGIACILRMIKDGCKAEIKDKVKR